MASPADWENGFCGDVLSTQRRLRSNLLDSAQIRQKPARDLAAHMLLNLDDLDACWTIATQWLRNELGCHRVDAGFGTPSARDYFPGYVEAKNADYDVPSFGGSMVYNFDPIMQKMWHDKQPIALADIKQDSRVTQYLRQRISGARTKSKIGGALRTRKGGYGLICADWTEHALPNESRLYDCFEQTVADVLSPIIAVSREIADRGHQAQSEAADTPSAETSPLEQLTASEMEVAQLVAQGMSYKEIARIRGRSFSTIDHQLRSIRQKTGAASTAALVSMLARMAR